MLPGKGKYILWAITSWIGAAAGVIFAYATYAQAVQQVEKNTYTMMLYIPYAPVYIFGFIGALAFTLALLLHAVKAVIAIFNDDYAKEIAKNNFITVR